VRNDRDEIGGDELLDQLDVVVAWVTLALGFSFILFVMAHALGWL